MPVGLRRRLSQQLRGAEFGRVGRYEAPDATVFGIMPLGNQVFAALESGFQLAVGECEATERELVVVHVVEVLGEEQPHSGLCEAIGVFGDVVRYFQHGGRAAAYGFQRAEQREDIALVGVEQSAPCGREAQRGRKAEVFQDAPVRGGEQVCVAVDQAREDRLAAPVETFGVRMASFQVGGRPYVRYAVAVHRDSRAVVNIPLTVAGYYRRVRYEGSHGSQAPSEYGRPDATMPK